MTPVELELARADSVRPGDEVQVGPLGMHVVESIQRSATGRLRIVYFATIQRSWENKARARRGGRSDSFLHLLSLATLAPDDVVTVVRGRGERAAELRTTMRRQEIERFAAAEERQRRAQYRREQAPTT